MKKHLTAALTAVLALGIAGHALADGEKPAYKEFGPVTAKNAKEAIALAAKVHDDKKADPDLRSDAYLYAGQTLCNKLGNKDGAMPLLLDAFNVATGRHWRAKVAYEFSVHCRSHMHPKRWADGRDVLLQVVSDESTDFADRLRTMHDYLWFARNAPHPEGTQRAIDFAWDFLKKHQGHMSDREIAYLRGDIAENQRWAQELDAAAETLRWNYENEKLPSSTRREAGIYLASRRSANNDPKGAEEFLVGCYSIPGININDYEALAKEIGKLHIVNDDMEGAIAAYRDCLSRAPDMKGLKGRIDNLIVSCYIAFHHKEEARDYWLENGNIMGAAEISAKYLDDWPAAHDIYVRVLKDEKADPASRRKAWSILFDTEPELTDAQYASLLAAGADATNDMVRILTDKLCSHGYASAHFAAAPHREKLYDLLERLSADAGLKIGFRPALLGAISRYVLGDAARGAKICEDHLAANAELSDADAYLLKMVRDLVCRGIAPAKLEKEVAAADRRHAGEIPVNDRIERLNRLGSIALTCFDNDLARAVKAYKASFYVPKAKRRYVVHYSETPVTGIASWKDIPFKPEVQFLDRAYGGKLDFVDTDVATGRSTVGIAKSQGAKNANPPTMQIVYDRFGIHFYLVSPEDDPRGLENSTVGGSGNWECYIAPGENQPYHCILYFIGAGAKASLFNTTYNTPGHRRIAKDGKFECKSEIAFTDNSSISYFSIPWDVYASLIPQDGAIWDFENVRWGRPGNPAWNGTESVHGRSTWGELEFDMPEKARVAILKRQLFRAAKGYRDEKYSGGGHVGVIENWSDPVVGDPDFHKACLKPLVERLDSYLPILKEDMSDADVIRLSDEVLADWRDIKFIVARLRARYLAERHTGANAAK